MYLKIEYVTFVYTINFKILWFKNIPFDFTEELGTKPKLEDNNPVRFD